jgi:dGTPase
VHDIGHPPFGHAGEKALDAAMRRHGLSFDHNLHALRIVEDFELRYAEFRGLNLSFEVREGIIKHSRDYDPRDSPELQEYLLGLRPPLEAQLLDLTDEIAYSVADLDDGYEARILGLDEIRGEVCLFADCYREASARFPSAALQLLLNEALKRMLDRMVTDLIQHTSEVARRAGAKSPEDVRSFSSRLAGFSETMERQRREVKEFLYSRLYFSPELVPEKEMAERIVTELFEFWMTHPAALPENYQEKFRQDSLPRIICDYIAGMTDNYILEQHQKLVKEAASR